MAYSEEKTLTVASPTVMSRPGFEPLTPHSMTMCKKVPWSTYDSIEVVNDLIELFILSSRDTSD